MSGIKKRWVRNYILIISVIFILIIVGFLIIMQKFYYNLAYDNLYNRMNVSADFYQRYMPNDNLKLDDIAQLMLRDYKDERVAELQILNSRGKLLYSSAGFVTNIEIASRDVLHAKNGGQGYWVGKNKQTNEKIMSVSRPILNNANEIIGILRYVTSMVRIDQLLYSYLVYAIVVFLIILLLLLILSMTFSRSILSPIKEITLVSKKMSEGNFGEKVPVIYKDELGVLAQTLNTMADEILKTNQMKNEFISSISHEIRTPLTAISGWAETILTGDLSNIDEVELGLKIIMKETGRLSEMVEELLDFSRIQSGRLTLFKEKFDLVGEIGDIVRIFRAKAEQRSIILEFPNYEKPIWMNADINRLRQVIINVLDNAVKFSLEGGKVDILIDEEQGESLSNDDYQADYVKISIIDYGVGISSKDIQKVKHKFYKGSSKKAGSGIGLAISNEIVNLHGGILEIESEEGNGTRIFIMLPRQ